MAHRHLARSVVLQTLFEWDFRGLKDKEAAVEILNRDAFEFAPGLTDTSFTRALVENIVDKKNDLDKIIEKAAPDWPIDKISIIDRNILRMGLGELLFSDRTQVPPKVAINEAIELAKTFGGETSGKFVNGVLGAVYKELGEPGKEEISKKKVVVPYEQMPIERLGGAVVFAKDDAENIYLALVHDIFGHWTLSKGHYNEGEEDIVGLQRIIKDELGLDTEVLEKLGQNEYIASDPEKGKIRKQVAYYLNKAVFKDIVRSASGGLDDARWFKITDIVDLNFYNDILPIVTKAINILLKK